MHMGMPLINLIEIDIKRFIDTHSIRTVYTQYAHSTHTVQCVVWGNCSDLNSEATDLCTKKAAG